MGTRLAPALATIHIVDLEEDYIQTRKQKPLLWVRYIDDVYDLDSLICKISTILEGLNQIHRKIQFRAKISLQARNFLDLTIYISPDFINTGILSTKIYFKLTNTLPFPLGSSYMPSHIRKGTDIGEFTRLICNTTSPVLFKYYQRKLINHFILTKYAKSIIRVRVLK